MPHIFKKENYDCRFCLCYEKGGDLHLKHVVWRTNYARDRPLRRRIQI